MNNIGLIGSLLLTFSAVPELVRTIKDGKCHMGWGFLLMWLMGEIFCVFYGFDLAEFPVGDADLSFGDGLCLRGRTLYMVQNRLNRIAVIRLSLDFTSGTVERTITDPDFAVPTTVDRFGPWLYAVNSQPPYAIVRVPR